MAFNIPTNVMRGTEFMIVLVGAVFSAYLFMDSLHHDKVDSQRKDLELEIMLLNKDLDRDEFARNVYEDREEDGDLSPGDARRLDYLYKKIERTEDQIDALEQRKAEL